jgi:hypothetical protein
LTRSIRRMGLPCCKTPPRVLHVFKSATLATRSAEITERMTGEWTRVRRTGLKSWVLERFTGTEWIKG